jgi:hypothetical protein
LTLAGMARTVNARRFADTTPVAWRRANAARATRRGQCYNFAMPNKPTPLLHWFNATPLRAIVFGGVVGGLAFLALVGVALAILLFTERASVVPPVKILPTTDVASLSSVEVLSTTGGSIPLAHSAPQFIKLKERNFGVIAVEAAGGQWPFQSGTLGSDKAAWILGTLVNYVIGLEANSDNTALLQSLTEDDLIQLVSYSGEARWFRYTGRQWVTLGQADVFRQAQPGLTMVLLGEKSEDQRLVVTASYIPEREATAMATATAAPTATLPPQALLIARVVGVRYSKAATEVMLSGGISNPSSEVVTVTVSDVRLLAASGAEIPLKEAEPMLPWALQPGEARAFVLHFSRPPAGTAIFRIGQAEFELSGLQ